MKLATGVEMLEITGNYQGKVNKIHPTLIFDDKNVVLVDAGYPSQEKVIREKIEDAGVSFNKLNKIIITHQDIDHVGSLSDILQELPRKYAIFINEEEKPYVQGQKMPLKLAQLQRQLEFMTAEMRAFYQERKTVYDNLRIQLDFSIIRDEEELPYCGGIKVIHTPGHTPGHVCLYLKNGGILIAGDTMNVVDGKLLGPDPNYTLDMDLATLSLKKLNKYNIQKVVCYHGGLFTDEPNLRIAELVE